MSQENLQVVSSQQEEAQKMKYFGGLNFNVLGDYTQSFTGITD